MKLARRFALAAALFAWTLAGWAQDFPSKPVRIVVPYAAGGGTDILARLIAERLRSDWGQPVIVENKAGAGGNIGAAEVARANADGHTLLMTAGGFAIAPAVYPQLPFDPLKDFAAVTQVATVPLILVVPVASPLNSVADLTALARRDGEKVTFATFGNATPAHLVGESINQLAGLKMTHVPYKGGMQALPDILAGNVTFGVLDAVSMMPLIRQGKLKALAVTGPKRLPALPERPTLVESGVAFDAVGWHAVFAPAGTPPAVVARINAAFNKAAATADIRTRIVDGGSIPIEPALSAEQWSAQFRREVGQWSGVARAAKVKAD